MIQINIKLSVTTNSKLTWVQLFTIKFIVILKLDIYDHHVKKWYNVKIIN